MRTWVKRFVFFIGMASFFLNPNFGCGGEDDPYEYGFEEMEGAAAGRWKVSGDGLALTINLRAATPPSMASRSAWIRAAHACGQRTFVRSAAACIDLGQLYIEGDVSDGASGVKVAGTFVIYGTKLVPGRLDLAFSDGSKLSVDRMEASTVSVSGQFTPSSRGALQLVTLARL